jgi:CHAT domain-containing protein
LDVKRIAALRLPHTWLVVLAACATAAGERRSTEGTISVARAFLAAGVRSVVATLRPVPDEEAAAFYPRFHQHVASGLAPAEALRQTQLECIARGDGAAAMWAAVQIIGE